MGNGITIDKSSLEGGIPIITDADYLGHDNFSAWKTKVIEDLFVSEFSKSLPKKSLVSVTEKLRDAIIM
tara:strand:- start:82 stop:288 length:207 start_codon:yes stop_codon:yes gene_type:complete